MSYGYFVTLAFAFAFILFVLCFIIGGIIVYFSERKNSLYFVFLQRVGKGSLYYNKKTKYIYYSTKTGSFLNTFEKYEGDIDEKEKK